MWLKSQIHKCTQIYHIKYYKMLQYSTIDHFYTQRIHLHSKMSVHLGVP